MNSCRFWSQTRSRLCQKDRCTLWEKRYRQQTSQQSDHPRALLASHHNPWFHRSTWGKTTKFQMKKSYLFISSSPSSSRFLLSLSRSSFFFWMSRIVSFAFDKKLWVSYWLLVRRWERRRFWLWDWRRLSGVFSLSSSILKPGHDIICREKKHSHKIIIFLFIAYQE